MRLTAPGIAVGVRPCRYGRSVTATTRPDRLLDALDPTQLEAVTTVAEPLAILAGAGSGKTRVLTRRIAYQSREETIDSRHVLAVTFTRKAAGELVERLEKLGVREQLTAGTFHSIALAQLRRRASERNKPMPQLLERKARIIAPLLKARNGAEAAVQASEVASEIEWAKARMVMPDGYEAEAAGANRRTTKSAADIAALYARYEIEKRKRRFIDFDDLIWWMIQVLEDDPEFAAVQRWRFRHLFVDEFQDANPAQLRLIRGWLGDRTGLCAVGDPDQSIYGFAGSDPRWLTTFASRFPGGRVVRLGANYRSTPEIMAAASAVLPASFMGDRAPVVTTRPSGPSPTITDYESDEEEAKGVARMLRDQHAKARPWSSMAVLYRTNAQSVVFEEALRKADIPMRLRGASGFLDRPEVKAALGNLSSSAKQAPGRAFTEHLTDLSADAAEAGDEQREHVEALLRLGREYLAADGGSGTLDGFRAFLTASLRADRAPVGGDAVELLTFHRAKGLEFETVFVVGLERGLVPISFADSAGELSEERRLLYVAMSRAEENLHLSWARQRSIGMRVANRTASPYLAIVHGAIDPEAAAAEAAAHAADPERVSKLRGDLKGSRTKRRSAGSADEGPEPDAKLMAALVEWRLGFARAAAVPAYVIFADATLREVARRQPTERKQLLDISGIGPVKLERYADELIRIVAENPVGGGVELDLTVEG